VSPDGLRVVIDVQKRSGPQDPGNRWLAVVPTAGGEVRALTQAWDRWPHAPRWTPDGTALVAPADDQGRSPLWLVDATTGEPTRLTQDDGAYTNVEISPDGRWVYALRSSLGSPVEPVTVPGTLAELTTTAADGTPLRAWVALPHGAGPDQPAPMLLWIHGGPLSSWNAWSWRWNPWLAVAQGYAVVLPDPALSTGYGIDFIRRGWGKWGSEPFTDLMSVTDAAVARDDIDADRVAAMGGSFGGYMANWVAGHTDRFRAIVSHAGLWALDSFQGTTDLSVFWDQELTPEAALANSPHRFVADIRTPMLVVHGDRDYRVPVGESIRLWSDLAAHHAHEDGTTDHRYLYFPDEHHWIMRPQHAIVWYETVFAFLAAHVLGAEWQRPAHLG
jgi:dipeptidyl aminopeptidase/acylaminoacyl peptidase